MTLLFQETWEEVGEAWLIRRHFFFTMDLLFRLKINTWPWKIVCGLVLSGWRVTDKREDAAQTDALGEFEGPWCRDGGNLCPLAPHPHRDTSNEKHPALGWGPCDGHCPGDPPGAAGADGCLVELSLSGESLPGCQGPPGLWHQEFILLRPDFRDSSCPTGAQEISRLEHTCTEQRWDDLQQNVLFYESWPSTTF